MVKIKKGRRVLQHPRSIKGEVRRYFKALYSQKEAPFIEFEDRLVSKISAKEAQWLEVLPTMEKIRVVWSVTLSKLQESMVLT